MKLILTVSVILFGCYANAGSSPVVKYCIERLPSVAEACEGVTSIDQIPVLRYCAEQISPVIVCKGVKTIGEIRVLQYCLEQMSANDAVACMEMKSVMQVLSLKSELSENSF